MNGNLPNVTILLHKVMHRIWGRQIIYSYNYCYCYINLNQVKNSPLCQAFAVILNLHYNILILDMFFFFNLHVFFGVYSMSLDYMFEMYRNHKTILFQCEILQREHMPCHNCLTYRYINYMNIVYPLKS